VKAVPQLGIVLGDETEAEGHAFVAKQGGAPIGTVTVEFQGMGALHISSEDPEALRIVEEAFRSARDHLLTLIAEKKSALVNAPGAGASGEAEPVTAEGERLDDLVVTGPAACCGDPVAAPPSDAPDGGL
jgi:hypothetical protein